MTRHPWTAECDCDFCFAQDVAAVARAYRDIRELNKSPLSNLPGWNVAARRFLEQREKGKPPVDPDAEQLAADVGGLCDEMRGVG